MAWLYSKPIIGINEAAGYLNATHQTANALVRDFQELEILKERTGYRRNREFVFTRYLSLFLE